MSEKSRIVVEKLGAHSWGEIFNWGAFFQARNSISFSLEAKRTVRNKTVTETFGNGKSTFWMRTLIPSLAVPPPGQMTEAPLSSIVHCHHSPNVRFVFRVFFFCPVRFHVWFNRLISQDTMPAQHGTPLPGRLVLAKGKPQWNFVSKERFPSCCTPLLLYQSPWGLAPKGTYKA